MFNEQEIQRYCEQYNLKCKVFPESIYIDSTYKNWICERRGQQYILKHQNNEQCKHKNHVHNKRYDDLEEIFKYIHKHDTKTVYSRNVRWLKIDRLLKRV
jgi:hypothetical protein